MTKAPMLADRRGLRWLLNGRVMPGGAIVILAHRGRRTSRTYRTCVEALIEDHGTGDIVICPAKGEQADWYRNLRAGGLIDVRLRGQSFPAEWRQLSQQQSRDALERYRRQHPVWSRLILRSLARTHHLAGNPVHAVSQSLPIIALLPTDTAHARKREASNSS